MDEGLARELCRLNTRFYKQNAASFSGTRQAPWEGWRRCLQELEASGGLASGQVASVLDVACGNLRFEQFLLQERPDVAWELHAVDNCDSLAQAQGPLCEKVDFLNADIAAALANEGELERVLCQPPGNLSVVFGFMHHVPTLAWRQRLLRALVGKTQPGGLVAVSFWQFMNHPKLAQKACATDGQAHAELGLPPLERNDYLLGWKDVAGAYRYCHHFDEEELDALVGSVDDAAQEIARFSADGRTGNLNRYVVLRVR